MYSSVPQPKGYRTRRLVDGEDVVAVRLLPNGDLTIISPTTISERPLTALKK